MTTGEYIGALLPSVTKRIDKFKVSVACQYTIMTQYNNGEITKEEADSQLAEKYGPAAKLTKMTITNIE